MIARRPALLPDFKSRVTVATCFVENAQGHVLLLRRTKVEEQAGTWCVPGGKQEKGETPTQTVIREVREETGIQLPAPALQQRTTRYVRIPGWDYEMHVFAARVPEMPEIVLDPTEHDDFTWRHPTDVGDLRMIKGQKEMIGVVFAGKDDDVVPIVD